MLVSEFWLSLRNLFHIVGPLKPKAKCVSFKLISHILKLLSENLLDIYDQLTQILGLML